MAKVLEKLLVVDRFGELLDFLTLDVLPLTELLLQNGAIKFLLGIEVPKDNRFVYFGMCRQVPSRGSSKSILREHLDRRFNNVLPLTAFFHK